MNKSPREKSKNVHNYIILFYLISFLIIGIYIHSFDPIFITLLVASAWLGGYLTNI